MLQGKEVTLGGRVFVAPPVPFACMRKYEGVFNGTEKATLTVMADVVLAALQRNYPDLTQEEFEAKYLDVANFRDAFNAVMRVSGTQESPTGEQDPGNPSIGTSSTAA